MDFSGTKTMDFWTPNFGSQGWKGNPEFLAMFEGNHRLVHFLINLARLEILDHGSLLPKIYQGPSRRGLNETNPINMFYGASE